MTQEPLKKLEDKLNTKWVPGLTESKGIIKDYSTLEITITTASLEELTKTMNIIHDHLCIFTRKHPEVNYSMQANRINPNDNTKHILKVIVKI